MKRDEIQDILDNQDDQEKHYDRNASLLVDEAAQAGESLSIEEAYKIVDSQFRDNQAQRLNDIKKIFESSLSSRDDDKIRLQKYQIGILDEKDPGLLNECHVEIRQFEIDSFNSSKKIEILESKAREVEKELSLSKCFVIIYGDDTQIYYFEKGELIQQINALYGLQYNIKKYIKADGLNKLVILEEIKKTIVMLYNQKRASSAGYLLVRCASRPCNHQILNYLISSVQPPEVLNKRIITECISIAIKNQCLSNILIINKNFNDLIVIKDQELHEFFLEADIFSLFDNGKLNTASPLVDTVLLCFEKLGSEFLKNEIKSYNKAFASGGDEKEIKINLHAKREILTLALVHYIMNWRKCTEEKYKILCNFLGIAFIKSSLSRSPSFCAFYITNHAFIFKHLDIENIKSLRFCMEAIPNSKYKDQKHHIFSHLEKRKMLQDYYDLIDIDRAYLLSKQYYLSTDSQLNISSEIFSRVNAILTWYLPTVLADIILQYLVPSVFDAMSYKIEKWNRSSQLDSETKIGSLKQLPAIQQTPGSADCGYWALFNTFKLLTEMPYAAQTYFNHPKIPEEIKISTSAQFEEFKAFVKETLSTSQEDLTAVDLADIFEQASMGGGQQLRKLFPDLQKKLLNWSKGSGGIPAYTIVNSELVAGESKLESAFAFGGCLPGLKMQMAINFYNLAQFKHQRQLHCILIGTAGHWHVQLLATSYFASGSINFFQVDSAAIPVQILQLINSHLEDLLKNPKVYVQNVAEELIAPIHGELMKFSDISKCPFSFKQLEEIQKHCEFLVKFFSAFGQLPLAKNYLPTLQLAKRISGDLSNKNVCELTSLSQRLANLYQDHATSMTLKSPKI